jgi:hypothetical protein
MSNNSITVEVAKLKASLNKELDKFTGRKIEHNTLRQVQIHMQLVVDEMVENGVIERRPLVDVNHISEIEHYEHMEKILLARISRPEAGIMEQEVAGNELTIIRQKLKQLKAEADQDFLLVFLKERHTFKPYDWHNYDF